MICKLEELTDAAKLKFKQLSSIPDILLSDLIKSTLVQIFKDYWKGDCYFNDCTFVVETSKEHFSFMPNQYFYFAVELYELATVLKKSFDVFDKYIREDEEARRVINALQAPIKKGIRIKYTDVEVTLRKEILTINDIFEKISEEDKINLCFLIGNMSENKKFGNLDNNTFRATSDLYGSYLLNVVPFTTAESGTFGDLMYALASSGTVYTNLLDNITKHENKKIEDNIIKLSTTAKECARQIISKIYDYDKLDKLKSILKLNTNIKIDTDEICPEDVLYNVFYTAGSKQFDDEKRTFLDTEYYIQINDIQVPCRLTNQWCGFGEIGDDVQSSRNYLWALRDIINIHYDGIFKIENEGANAKLIYYSEEKNTKNELVLITSYNNTVERNRIIFGAPGTGKSYKLNKDAMELVGMFSQNGISVPDSDYYERVTFHPNYSYAQFVGTYKPISKSIDGKENISYEFIPGAFIRLLVKALKNARDGSETKPYLLIIEEINRANVAAVFGDIFQLLDRNGCGISEYEIETSEDLRKYLSKTENLGGKPEDYKKIRIPNNLFIWATMNSADQGVFPMDTAFKRRWEFEYIGIDENEKEVETFYIPINDNKKVKWNELRKAINDKLIELGINEDKLLGPFFLNKTMLENAMNKDSNFIKSFESKVLMYLFEDAAKMKVRQLFNLQDNKYIYSEICKKFEKEGLGVFNFTENSKITIEDIGTASQLANGELF